MGKSLSPSEAVSIEIGLDEELNELPIELMIVDGAYLCLKHNVGRYVVSSRIPKEPRRPDFTETTERRVLLVSVPDPQLTAEPLNAVFGKLDLVETEANEKQQTTG